MLDMKFHDLNAGHVSFVYDLYEVLNVDIRILLKSFYAKEL